LLECPLCTSQFFAEADPEEDDEADADEQAARESARRVAEAKRRAGIEDVEDDAAAENADELNALRIRQLSLARRALYRGQSYWIILVVLLATALIRLAMMTVTHVRTRGWEMKPIGYLLFALLALFGLVFVGRRIQDLNRKAAERPPEEPLPEPDFSTLSDGSQYARNLERMEEGENRR
jgi:hypothetical protein